MATTGLTFTGRGRGAPSAVVVPQRRVPAVLRIAACVAAAVFVLLTVGYVAEREVVASSGYAAAWWCACLATAVLAVAACVAGADPDEDRGYTGTLVEGLRAEWRAARHR